MMFISCSYGVHIVFILCLSPVHMVFLSCSYGVHIAFISCSYCVYLLFISCLSPVHMVFISILLKISILRFRCVSYIFVIVMFISRSYHVFHCICSYHVNHNVIIHISLRSCPYHMPVANLGGGGRGPAPPPRNA